MLQRQQSWKSGWALIAITITWTKIVKIIYCCYWWWNDWSKMPYQIKKRALNVRFFTWTKWDLCYKRTFKEIFMIAQNMDIVKLTSVSIRFQKLMKYLQFHYLFVPQDFRFQSQKKLYEQISDIFSDMRKSTVIHDWIHGSIAPMTVHLKVTNCHGLMYGYIFWVTSVFKKEFFGFRGKLWSQKMNLVTEVYNWSSHFGILRLLQIDQNCHNLFIILSKPLDLEATLYQQRKQRYRW